MRKLTERHKRLLLYRSRKEMARRSGHKNAPTEGASKAVRLPSVPTLRRGRDLIIEAPREFSLSSNYEEVILFLNAIRRMALRHVHARRIRRILDLSPIRTIGIGAAVVLAAEADRWRQLLSVRPVPYDEDNWAPSVKSIVRALGIFELMDRKPLPSYETDGGLVVMPLRSGTGSKDVGPETNDFLTSLVDLVGELRGKQAYFEGICEAILNASHHAYQPAFIRPGQPPWISRSWWAAGAYSRHERELTILVYDQGAGIPFTLPASKVWNPVTQFLRGEPTHSELISGALRYRITRTEESGRGEGLAQLAYLVKQSESGYLRIMSGTGEIEYDGATTSRFDHELELGGTLIEWEIGLPQKEGLES